MKIKIIFVVFMLFSPSVISAEEANASDGLLPALCRQILAYESGEKELTVDNIVSKVKALPGEMVAGAADKIDGVADYIAESLEGTKSVLREYSPNDESRVLGAVNTDKNYSSRLYNQIVDALSFLLRNWLWTFSGLGIIFIAWRLFR